MEKLFTYGTLQDPLIQMELFGRIIFGTTDKLVDYEKRQVKIENKMYDIAHKKAGEKISGIVYELNEKDLKESDEYEGKDYKRIKVQLVTGTMAYVYITA